MEKIKRFNFWTSEMCEEECDCYESKTGEYVLAIHYDALREAVKALVEAAKNLAIKSAENKGDITAEDFGKLWKAIAAVERLEVLK